MVDIYNALKRAFPIYGSEDFCYHFWLTRATYAGVIFPPKELSDIQTKLTIGETKSAIQKCHDLISNILLDVEYFPKFVNACPSSRTRSKILEALQMVGQGNNDESQVARNMIELINEQRCPIPETDNVGLATDVLPLLHVQ